MAPNTYLLSIFIFIVVLTLCACRSDKGIERPNVSHIEVNTEIRRFERDLFSMDTTNMEAEQARMDTLYGEFAQVFFYRILGIDQPHIAQEGPSNYLRGFITHPMTRQLYDTIQLVYPDLNQEKEHFDQAFRYLKYYFPMFQPPRITTFFSEFSIANFVYGDDELAIGLDLYLGEDYPYESMDPGNPVFSKYLTRTYNRDHMVPRTLKPLLEDMVGPPGGERLIDHILRNGKILYLQDLLLPEIADTAKFEFTPVQLEWLKDNERNMWAYFTTENLLYSTDWKKYRKFIEYSPHSPGMPEEAPGRTGDWIGLLIVRAWLERHPTAGPAELLEERDAQSLLDASRFQPKR